MGYLFCHQECLGDTWAILLSGRYYYFDWDDEHR